MLAAAADSNLLQNTQHLVIGMPEVVLHWRIRQCNGENTLVEVRGESSGHFQYDGASVRVSDDTHVPSSSPLNEMLPDVAAMILGSRTILEVER